MSDEAPIFESVPLDTLEHHPDNVRRHVTKELVKESLNEHGQYKPMVVQRSTRFVLAGNGLLEALSETGQTHGDVRWVDVDDAQARKILLVDNASTDQWAYDEAKLRDVLREIKAEAGSLLGTGYTDEALREALEATEDANTAFLDRFVDDELYKDDEGKEQVVAVAGDTLFRLAFMLELNERDIVTKALDAKRKHDDLDSRAHALVDLCEDYMRVIAAS